MQKIPLVEYNKVTPKRIEYNVTCRCVVDQFQNVVINAYSKANHTISDDAGYKRWETKPELPKNTISLLFYWVANILGGSQNFECVQLICACRTAENWVGLSIRVDSIEFINNSLLWHKNININVEQSTYIVSGHLT